MKQAFIQLHIAVFLAGFTALLGRLIHLNEAVLVWYRLLITAAALWFLYWLKKPGDRISPKNILRSFLIGSVLGLHWIVFYASIKYASISVALVCFSAIGFFTACIEPLLTSRKADAIEFLLGLLVIFGISLIFHFDPHYKKGILFGLAAALTGAVFPVLNRNLLKTVSVGNATVYQMTGGFIFLSAILPFYLNWFPASRLYPTPADWIWLLILSLICTVYAFTLSMKALKTISAFTVNLTYNLEPLYGIALAFLVYREDKIAGPGFYYGLAIIILAIALQMFRLLFKWRMQHADR